MNPSRVILLAPLIAACGLDGAVSSEAQLLVPADVTVYWDAALNERDDGLGVLLPVDVMVYDGGSGDPVEGAALELSGGAQFALPLHVLFETHPESFDGRWWDARRDQTFEWAVEPTRRLTVETDATGLARFYVFVDRFPSSPHEAGLFEPVRVRVHMGSVQDTFRIVPR